MELTAKFFKDLSDTMKDTMAESIVIYVFQRKSYGYCSTCSSLRQDLNVRTVLGFVSDKIRPVPISESYHHLYLCTLIHHANVILRHIPAT